jgi:hypothetical protein
MPDGKKSDDTWMYLLGTAAAVAFVTWQVQKYMSDKAELADLKAAEKLRAQYGLTEEEAPS